MAEVRNPPYINGIQVADHGWASFSASAEGQGVTFPRGRGVFLKEMQIPTVTLRLHCWSIFETIQAMEAFFNQDIPNRFTGNSLHTLFISGNNYYNCSLNGYNRTNQDKLTAQYTFEFTLGDQGTGTITADLKNGAGTEAIFTVPAVQILDRTLRSAGTFHFWSHAYSSVNTQWLVTDEVGSIHTLKVLGGGLSELSLAGWVIGPDIGTRKNLEKYFLSMTLNPCGRFGSLVVSGCSYNPALMVSMDMGEEDKKIIEYNARFLTSTIDYI